MASITDELWEVDHIAAYIHRSKKTVQNRTVKDKTFPRAVELPNGRYWMAREVKAWVMSHRITPTA